MRSLACELLLDGLLASGPASGEDEAVDDELALEALPALVVSELLRSDAAFRGVPRARPARLGVKGARPSCVGAAAASEASIGDCRGLHSPDEANEAQVRCNSLEAAFCRGVFHVNAG